MTKMSASTANARAYPKRKRAEVSYFEDDASDASETDEYNSDVEEASPRKKAKVTPVVVDKPLSKKKIFPFVSLPAELRNKIYGYALTDKDLFLISKSRGYRRSVQIGAPSESRESRYGRRGRWGRIWPSTPTSTETPSKLPSFAPNILLLNHQIYAEAQPVLYGNNSFAIEDTAALHAFCANIGPKNCASVREIRIKGWGQSKAYKAMNHPAFTILANAVNLERLYIDCQIHYGTPALVARQLFREGHHWLKSRGVAAIEIMQLSETNLSPRYGQTSDDANKEKNMKEFKTELRKLMDA